jgi:hypothetical protein
MWPSTRTTIGVSGGIESYRCVVKMMIRCCSLAKSSKTALGVEARDGLVQDHDRSILVDEPRQRQPLPLPAREVDAAAESGTHQRIEPIGQAGHHRAEPRELQGPADARVLVGCPLVTHRDILSHRQVQVGRLLEENRLRQLLRGHAGPVRQPGEDRAGCRREQAGQQLNEGALPGAVRPDDGRRPRTEGVGDVGEGDLLAMRVVVAHALQEKCCRFPRRVWRGSWRMYRSG